MVGRLLENGRRGSVEHRIVRSGTQLDLLGNREPLSTWMGREEGGGSARVGDNLYSDSVVALDADTGKLKWYYQFTPHDNMDWDATEIPVLTDIPWQGRPRK